MHKRWYDIDPTVSLAVSLIRNASEHSQGECAEFMIDYAKRVGITLKNNGLNDAFNYLKKRWYDQDEKISEAFEYLENSPLDVQREIALEVIGLLQFSD